MENPAKSRSARAESATVVWLCRPGFEAVLGEELAWRVGTQKLPVAPQEPAPAGAPQGGVGWLSTGLPAGAGAAALHAPLIFERQRLPGARFFPAEAPAALARALAAAELPRLDERAAPYTLHVFTPDPTGERSLAGRAAALERAVLEHWAEAAPASHARCLAPEPFRQRKGAPGTVWQLCLVPGPGAGGVWSALTAAGVLTDSHPGGVHRVHMDPGAPSRSYLKVEEALERMGLQPRPRESVVDLGAAPGGWSYAFLQRGCRVLAVDHGPLKLRDPGALPGALTHLRQDGLSFQPPKGWAPVDWLLSDMLVPPGVTLGLLRKWLGAGWARRFIVNVKLPQRQPLAALLPLEAFLAGVPGLHWQLRQLYHDRREVTLMGTAAVSAVCGPGPRPHRRVDAAKPRPPRPSQGGPGRQARAPGRRRRRRN